MCVDIFGPKFNMTFLEAAAERTNTLYGGLDIEADNVVYVHGSIDPWHALGITKTLELNAPSIYIKGKNFHRLHRYNITITSSQLITLNDIFLIVILFL